jgi:hypothetical protein
VEKNPEVTKALATTFMNNPIFEDIAKGIEPPQGRTHYLPTTLPTPYIIQPVGINPRPMKVCATMLHKEIIVAMTNAMKLIINAIKIDGSLKGRIPKPFKGD